MLRQKNELFMRCEPIHTALTNTSLYHHVLVNHTTTVLMHLKAVANISDMDSLLVKK